MLWSLSEAYAQAADSTKRPAVKIVDTRSDKPKNFSLAVAPFTHFLPYSKPTEQVKTISNVKVYPTPVSDQINVSFKLNKDIQVSIKIMDALGNEVTTLLSQRLTAGEQSHSFSVNGKLNSGYYFIRLMAGSETIIKRIQVL